MFQGESPADSSANGVSEESQLEAESAALPGVQIASVVPPLRLEVGMAEVVARELVVVAGTGGVEAQCGRRRKHHDAKSPFHSSWTTSIGFNRAATRAG